VTLIKMQQPLSCPFCNHPVDLTDPDTLYPTGVGWLWDVSLKMRTYHTVREVPKAQWCYALHCLNLACGAEVHGDSKEDVMVRWSTRKGVVCA
jgi:hypothetical protein